MPPPSQGTRRVLTEVERMVNNPELASGDLVSILKELQGLKVSVATGANVNTNMAVTGIATEDVIVGAVAIAADTAATIDVLAEIQVTSAGNVQVVDTNLTGYKVIVIWLDKSGAA